MCWFLKSPLEDSLKFSNGFDHTLKKEEERKEEKLHKKNLVPASLSIFSQLILPSIIYSNYNGLLFAPIHCHALALADVSILFLKSSHGHSFWHSLFHIVFWRRPPLPIQTKASLIFHLWHQPVMFLQYFVYLFIFCSLYIFTINLPWNLEFSCVVHKSPCMPDT